MPRHVVEHRGPEVHAPHLRDVGLRRAGVVRVARRTCVERDVELDAASGDVGIDLAILHAAQVASDPDRLGQVEAAIHGSGRVGADRPPARRRSRRDLADRVPLRHQAADDRLTGHRRVDRTDHDLCRGCLRRQLVRRSRTHGDPPRGKRCLDVPGGEPDGRGGRVEDHRCRLRADPACCRQEDHRGNHSTRYGAPVRHHRSSSRTVAGPLGSGLRATS